ncbi:hypothetical protein QQS21_002268 [Conoideocrella luteorostrata]|uniref:ABC transporter domain-containing protein n=1 Tax=Conoideocrella luteorostrata TaxID=1105319 RepID=A0AAJ0G311_9HYPO|nr:hypothetical protein QQS21_002268 [Conoideocrella luteorostrata]
MTSRPQLQQFSLKSLPQDPFLPIQGPFGPSFLDTEACICALQATPGRDAVGWQCLGNSTQGVYTTTGGKWFHPQGRPAGGVNGSVSDASSPPDTSKPQFFDSSSRQFVSIGADTKTNLDIYSRACTGKNQTTFSTAFYRAAAQLDENKVPIDAAPCYRPGAIPLQIQEAESWTKDGCNLGFLCANNTINSLPQFCPPITECQEARLTGNVCNFQGANIGMGPFEPVVCLQGNYCPPGGKRIVKCPSGHYCQPGAATPTPCSFGSRCPEGSQFDQFLIPIFLLVLVDIALVIAIVWHTIAKRFLKKKGQRSRTFGTGQPGQGLMRTMTMGAAGYHGLADENDQEMEMALNATYTPGADPWYGFQAALDMATVQGTRVEQVEGEKGLSPQLRAFVESMRKAADAQHFGLTFGYTNLSFQPRRAPRPILQNVTGSIKRGSLVAVMGGSGAGKSTFVNVLMGKITRTKGLVTINDVPGRIKRYKKVIGYVPQDDIVLPELTVYENILHSAQIRLPRTWSKNEILAHVNAVIDCLELSHVRDSLVGSVGKPVISGGQRKRVSIGMELAAAPMAIFLDEPTSGLDATAASSIMKTLQALARLGMSIIVVIHQPRMEIFDMLDDLILLASGQIIYEGPEKNVRRFFENIGFNIPAHSNFGDVVTDIITGNGRAYKRSGDISKEGLIAHWANCRENTGKNTPETSRASQLSFVNTLLPKMDQPVHQILKTRGATPIRQLWLCLRRSFVQQYRTKSMFWFEMGLASLAGFLIGLAQNGKKGVMFIGFYKQPFNVLSIATDMISVPQLALLTAIGIGLVSAAPGVRVFSEEMLLQRRESEAGHSQLAYFMAKILAVIPRMILTCLHFTTLMMILSNPIISWGLAFIANLMYVYCIYGLASCISMVTKREDAPLFATMISLIVGILSGAAPPLSQVKKWGIEWLWRASPGTWLAELYFGQLVAPFGYLYDVDLASELTGFRLYWTWRNILILFAIGTIYRVLAYLGLFLGKRLRL